MKPLIYLICVLILLSCFSKKTNNFKKQECTHESLTNSSKLPQKKISTSSIIAIKKCGLDEYLEADSVKFITNFFGQKLYQYSYKYDTIVNKTPLVFLYLCIGGENSNVVYKRMLDELNNFINEMIETATIQSFPILYSILKDDVKVNHDLKYVRKEQFFMGGAGESYNEYIYNINENSIVDFIEEYKNYKSDSYYLKSRLISETRN